MRGPRHVDAAAAFPFVASPRKTSFWVFRLVGEGPGLILTKRKKTKVIWLDLRENCSNPEASAAKHEKLAADPTERLIGARFVLNLCESLPM